MKIVIARIKGGLGNQLFCYAAARRLALVNDAELALDNVTGFIRDIEYRRQYALDCFNIPCRKATPQERFEPFSRYRRYIEKTIAKRESFFRRRYIEEEGPKFDSRLLRLRSFSRLYLDGLWQSEAYFKDVESVIRKDLRVTPPTDEKNLSVAQSILKKNAVALHVRWFDKPNQKEVNNISKNYYQRAIALIDEKINSPHYFLFSDKPNAALEKLSLDESRVTIVSHNNTDEMAYADLWLMMQCKHFITANSTFSWWAAWLNESKEKIVIHPKRVIVENKDTPWGLEGSLPFGWISL